MKIAIYCQHVLGLGHFFRTLEIADALAPDTVLLITGGKPFEVAHKDHIKPVVLPGIMMDEQFSSLYSVDPERSLDTVKQERTKILTDLLLNEKPDLFLIELYPFGRRAFRFELEPAVNAIQQHQVPCKVVCSIRDILVEKSDVEKYENRVIKALNRHFDAVLVHSDPRLIRLDTTFSRLDEIAPPVTYTGFITPMPEKDKVTTFLEQYKPTGREKIVVVSIGSGSVGAPLLISVARSYEYLEQIENLRILMFTGPYMDEADIETLKDITLDKPVHVERFCEDFVSLIKAADLSVSMAGYNTCMNLVAAGTPSLVWPFDQNREQRMRAEELGRFARIRILEAADLEPERMAARIDSYLGKTEDAVHQAPGSSPLNIDGAVRTAGSIKDLAAK
ncbi:MAG: glycosyl transferase [Desulfobacteraceae bacterium]|nr:MAG: glycosyl transferase [Desulfobacteraceae bacterium]